MALFVRDKHLPAFMSCDFNCIFRFWVHITVTMGAMASQITSLAIVHSIDYSGAHRRIHQSSASLAFMNSPVTGEFSAQMASKAGNVSIWWRHHWYANRRLLILKIKWTGLMSKARNRILVHCPLVAYTVEFSNNRLSNIYDIFVAKTSDVWQN